MTAPITTIGLGVLTPTAAQVYADAMAFVMVLAVAAAVLAVKYLMRK